jgi:hypothetical protein
MIHLVINLIAGKGKICLGTFQGGCRSGKLFVEIKWPKDRRKEEENRE